MQIFDVYKFRLIADALYSTGGFNPTVTYDSNGIPTKVASQTYLIPYPRESSEKFARRNEVAWYVSDLLSCCSKYVGYLTRKLPYRVTKNPIHKDMIDDCNWKGDSLDVFWNSFMIDAKARGNMLLLVNKPREEDLDKRDVPYLVKINPEDVLAYKINGRGLVEYIKFMDNTDPLNIINYNWDTEGWWIDGDDVKHLHGLGLCPVIIFSEKSWPEFGEFSQIADVSVRLFNARSELDEILRSQTFSLLTMQIPPEMRNKVAAANTESEISTNNMLVYFGSNAPTYVAPDSSPAEIYNTLIEKLNNTIKQIGHIIENTDRSESGIALKIKFQALNASLSSFSSKMEDFEKRMWDVVSAWQGGINPPAIAWATDFSISDSLAELQVLQAMIETGFPQVVLNEKRKQIIHSEFGTANSENLIVAINETIQANDNT